MPRRFVETEEGLKPIEEIEVGDKVLAYDEQTGEQAYKSVVRLFRNTTKEWYHVFVNGEEIVCTGGHPFYVQGKGFVPAKELKETDLLELADCTEAFIDKITIEKLGIPETTYNFEVADFHTYYVSDCKVLVHNVCAENDGGFKLANRGQSHSGRRTPTNLKEKLAMEQAMSNPLAGKQLPVKMTDPRWLGSEGWVKMQQTFTFFDGTGTTIHYVLNKSLRLIDDFKFVFPL